MAEATKRSEIKTVHYCSACDKHFKSETWALKHLVTSHDGAAMVETFTYDKFNLQAGLTRS